MNKLIKELENVKGKWKLCGRCKTKLNFVPDGHISFCDVRICKKCKDKEKNEII